MSAAIIRLDVQAVRWLGARLAWLCLALTMGYALAAEPGGSQEVIVPLVMETSLGSVELEVYADRAPATAANFLAYVDGGHFDGAAFYRVVRGDNQLGGGYVELVQGGLLADRYLTSSDDNFPGLASLLPPVAHESTRETGIPNAAGVLGMARGAPGTATSEFYVNLVDNPALDTGNTVRQPDGKGYATFGRVTSGLAVLREIQALPTDRPRQFELFRGQLLNEPVRITRIYRVSNTRGGR